eukprot:TRINITY_DN48240_c0_g1_i1.p4 TRINITY_DN48240_c0_g1~~TRINITY_DN48240_c0_g1_i1.p4  ORF type:complete len:100 (-),score=0.03 TRINITY_DN48240_c0_g1_i1:203-502(-)
MSPEKQVLFLEHIHLHFFANSFTKTSSMFRFKINKFVVFQEDRFFAWHRLALFYPRNYRHQNSSPSNNNSNSNNSNNNDRLQQQQIVWLSQYWQMQDVI